MSRENIARDKFLVLEVVNIFQPIEKRRLIKILGEKYTASEVNAVLKKLLVENRIVAESKKYRLTKYGLQTGLPGEARIIRDKYRMHYLYERWKNRGGAF